MPLTSPAILRCYGIVGLFFFLLFQQIAWWPFLIKSYESIQKLQPSACSAQNNVLSNTMYYWNSNFLAAVIWVGSQLPHTTSLPWQQVWYPLGEQTRRLKTLSNIHLSNIHLSDIHLSGFFKSQHLASEKITRPTWVIHMFIYACLFPA